MAYQSPAGPIDLHSLLLLQLDLEMIDLVPHYRESRSRHIIEKDVPAPALQADAQPEL